MVTMPTNGAFYFYCQHCRTGNGKKPKEMKDDGQDYKLHFCGQCKKSTLMQFRGDVCALFRVEK